VELAAPKKIAGVTSPFHSLTGCECYRLWVLKKSLCLAGGVVAEAWYKEEINRPGRFQESKRFEQLFEQIVRQCVAVGLVRRDDLSVDGSFVEANASKESRVPREQLAEAAQVNQTVRHYLVELEQQNPTEEPVHE